ncbi:beta-ketoacyl synthase N-terminal-like domain-containing protein [Buchnera aphidicola (Formosaphis micheliae)]|uniref:beta-ketoacyl synthase N-terminal-like domain-containing protein n=1 Tax=Buchnera aphidicola TaxID=9 RepID=UPI0031B8045D
MKRVVITGLGIISSIGNNKNEVLYCLKNGKSGISFSQKMKNMGLRSHIWGNIKLNTKHLINYRMMRFMNDASIYAYLSMLEAVKDAFLSPEIYTNNIRIGLIVGSAGGSPKNQISGIDSIRSSRGLKSVSPYIILKTMSSSVSACLSTIFNICGVSYSISSACSSSANCIGNAFELIQLGKQDIIFTGGAEELNWELAYQFDAIGALSTHYNISPETASRAFDIDRDGFVISGGAGILVIEELFHALSRGANIYGEIIGYGSSSNGFHMVTPSKKGSIHSMVLALNEAKTSIDYVNVHATSTQLGDVEEIQAIYEVFGKNKVPYISATKSMTGHSLGASGVHEIIYSLLMMKYNFIAPSINIVRLDPNIKDVSIITKTFYTSIKTIMSNNFGFGGVNVTLIIKKYFSEC